MPQGPTDPLAWLTVAAFVAGSLLELYDRRWGRRLTAGAWALFAVFWLVLVPYYAFDHKSIIEAVLSAAAVPASLYVGYLLLGGRDSLMVLSRGVAVMGLVYLPFTTVEVLAEPLVEETTRQVQWVLNVLGYHPELVTNEAGYLNTFLWVTNDHRYLTEILLACTGLGSISIFLGLVAAVRAPLDRKLRALAVSVPVIWVLNIGRNVFIAVAQGKQWFADVAPGVVMFLFGSSDPHLVSFLWADRVISQSLAVVALVGILGLVLRQLPELGVVVEDLLYVATGNEYSIGREPPSGGTGGAGGPSHADD